MVNERTSADVARSSEGRLAMFYGKTGKEVMIMSLTEEGAFSKGRRRFEALKNFT